MPTEDEIKPKVIDAFAHRTDLSPAAVAALVDARTDDPQAPVSAMRKGHTVAAQVSSGPCAGWRNQWTRALAFGLCVLLVGLLPARAAITPTIPSTGVPATDKLIDDEAKALAKEFATAGRKLGSTTDKAALEEEGISDAKSSYAKRLLAQIRVEYPLLIEGQLTMNGTDPKGKLGRILIQNATEAAAKQKADEDDATSAAQILKTEAAVRTPEAQQAVNAKAPDAAVKQIVVKALTEAATTVAKSADTPDATTGQGTDTAKTVKSDATVVNGAKIQVADSLKLATVNLFAGRAYLWSRPWSVEVTSTLPASTVNSATSTTYSDAQLQLPDGGILNIRTGLISNLLNLISNRQDYFEAGSKVTIYGDRASEFDRYYFNGGHILTIDKKDYKEISVGDALIYFRDGLDFKGIYRPTFTAASGTAPAANTPSTKTGDYGIAAGYYAALGFDGGLFSQQQALGSPDSGNYRLELLFTSQFTDRGSLKALYPAVVKPTDLSYAAGGRFVIALNNHLNLDLQALWPFGASRRYMKSTLIGGFSLTR